MTAPRERLAPAAGDLSSLRLEPHERRAGGSRRQVALVGVALALVVAALIVAAVIASSGESAQAETAAPAASSAPGPAASSAPSPTPPSASDSGGQVAAGGYVEARRSAVLRPGRDGVVAQVHVTLGHSVHRGDLLLELENQPDRAEEAMAAAEVALAEARLQAVRAGSRAEEVEAAGSEAEAADASLSEASEDLSRLESLQQSGAVTAAEVDRARQRARGAEARLAALRARERMLRRGNLPTDVAAATAQLDQARAQLDRARAQFELTRLRAPFDGTILALDIEPGEVVSVQSPRDVMTLADLSELWVRVDVPEGRISRVAPGAAAEVVVDALGPDRLAAEVVEIAPIADRQSNTVSVAVRLRAPPALIRPNMSARVFVGARGER
jgi:HlyD family secretion protein